MSTCGSCKASGCSMSRRGFLAAGGAAAMAAELGLLDFAPSLCAGESEPAGKPVVRVVFVRPDKEPIVSWPGGNCDVPAQQALFTKTLQDAAKALDVQLEVRAEPLYKNEDVAAFLEQLKKTPPDGLIVCAQSLFLWQPVNDIVQKRGDIPTIVYSHVTGFTSNLQCARTTPKTYMGATHEVEWLAFALRMLRTLWRLKTTRILMVTNAGPDVTLKPWGTVLHPINRPRFEEEYKKVEESSEIRAIADLYTQHAEKVVEPTRQEIVNAAKNYVVCHRLMQAEKCQGISIACLGWTDPVCLAFSRLLDKGIVGGCEGDANPIIGELLTMSLFNRAGFIQDPSPNTVNNTLIGAHCTSPLKLEGFDNPYRAPYMLRSYHTRTGCSPQVLWPVGKEVTVLHADANSPQIWVGTGRVRSNIPQPPTGCCRTSVEIELNGVADTRDVKGFHQLFILGNLERMFKAYAQLADIKVHPIA
ncbi:MAG: hypothetical protein NTW87_34625 [Planctomycetota bacterium]|nr:hypothetical protein [Planctomycetota bacterium]